jgi:uncharacterized membrane protein YfcA
MKFLFFLWLGLSFLAALLGFALLAGLAAAIFKCLFFGLFISAMVLMLWPRKSARSTPSTFAASFPSDSEPAPKTPDL